ncbi:uncharacterized protein PV07_04062 [Cladophialophora immunda]|uniref:Uncharacterized protein n=1 Tax=Cladophialophora immunda TaxID=569365 RepID=A0A0D2CMV1_9EURO|nr:uncharacterized protein PV07_04062 [Cladophialophora immunda]KIW32528.1 hypothetical protein PV07_04062 [Cladophialophora immunda]
MAFSLRFGMSNTQRRRIIAFALCFAIFIVTAAHYRLQRHKAYGRLVFPVQRSVPGLSDTLGVTGYDKPNGLKIIGIVFFGRRSRVEMLRCFLERNLVDNGGWLDEIHWVKNTDNHNDLAYLDEILSSSQRYKKVDVEGVGFVGYGQAWSQLEPGNLYVKIDDDVVWFADDTIPRIVSMKLAHPEFLLVSANIVNSPLMGWVHYHMGALHPYMPELTDYEPNIFSLRQPSRKPWTYWSYPNWTGPDDYFFGPFQGPPYTGHRWLRLPNESDIFRTPVADIEYKTWGTGLKSWAIAAQEHYSFLENLANDRLDTYRMGSSAGQGSNDKVWLPMDQRLSINLIAVWADDVLDNLPMDDVDEQWLTLNLPKKLQRQVAVNMDALAAHFTFGTQGTVETTDLLARYRDYAVEHACARWT